MDMTQDLHIPLRPKGATKGISAEVLPDLLQSEEKSAWWLLGEWMKRRRVWKQEDLLE